MDMKRIALFVPCYVNDFYPQAAMATWEVLQAHGYEADYPEGQSCCGQPFINNGLPDEAAPLADRFVEQFARYDYIVAPSSSCVGTVRYRYEGVVRDKRYAEIKNRVYELCEFLHDVVGLENLSFPKAWRGRAGLHNSCHALRELGLGAASERPECRYSKIKAVLSKIPELEIVEPSRDECCGFGGTFSVQEPEISAMMGRDRIADHLANGVSVMAGVDMSCLMHMEGLARRDGTAMRFVHVAQLMTGRGMADIQP
jgi:L-lactate dehydrogenase complex protein LldE